MLRLNGSQRCRFQFQNLKLIFSRKKRLPGFHLKSVRFALTRVFTALNPLAGIFLNVQGALLMILNIDDLRLNFVKSNKIIVIH